MTEQPQQTREIWWAVFFGVTTFVAIHSYSVGDRLFAAISGALVVAYMFLRLAEIAKKL